MEQTVTAGGIYRSCMIDGQRAASFLPKPMNELISAHIDSGTDEALHEALQRMRNAEFMMTEEDRYSCYAKLFIKREAVGSLKTARAKITFEDAFAAVPENGDSMPVHIKRYTEALEYIRDTAKIQPIDIEYMKKLNSFISDKNPGEYRDRLVYDCFRNKIGYVPCFPEETESLMKDLEQFVNSEDYHNPLLKAIMVYYQLLCIRPFYSASERTSRLIFMAVLIKFGALGGPYVAVSDFLYRKMQETRNKLYYARCAGRYSQMVDMFARGIYDEAMRAMHIAENAARIYDENTEKINRMSGSKKIVRCVMEFVKENPVADIAWASKNIGIGYDAMQRGVEKLKTLGIVTCVGKEGKPTAYSNNAVMALFE